LVDIYSTFIKDFGHSKEMHVSIAPLIGPEFQLMEKKAIF